VRDAGSWAVIEVRTPWGRGEAEDGISIVEVLVAITLLAVTMAATASSVIASLQVARDSRESVIAANIAQFELERLRAIPFVDWVTAAGVDGTTTDTGAFDGPDGQRYEVTRRAVWVPAGSTTDGCTSGTGDSDYVRVSQTVTFPGRDIPPVTNETIITPRLAFFDPFTGNLAIRVRDRDGNGSAGQTVRIQGRSGERSAITDAEGCAFFAYLAIDPATPLSSPYDLIITQSGFVDRTGQPSIVDVVSVSAQDTTFVQYDYDVSATIRPVPQVPDVTPGWRVPVDLGYTLRNAAFGVPEYRAYGPVAVAAGIGSLFPAVDGYGLHAGICPASDPRSVGGDRVLVATDPGADVTAAVPLALAAVTATGRGEGQQVDVYADSRDPETCEVGERLYLGLTDGDGILRAALPFGRWVMHWVPSGQTPAIPTLTCSPTVTCTDLRADITDPAYAVDGQAVTAQRYVTS
jgi:type II secretory pathway pseudopilin PulG